MNKTYIGVKNLAGVVEAKLVVNVWTKVNGVLKKEVVPKSVINGVVERFMEYGHLYFNAQDVLSKISMTGGSAFWSNSFSTNSNIILGTSDYIYSAKGKDLYKWGLDGNQISKTTPYAAQDILSISVDSGGNIYTLHAVTGYLCKTSPAGVVLWTVRATTLSPVSLASDSNSESFPADTIYVTGQGSSNYNSGGYSGTLTSYTTTVPGASTYISDQWHVADTHWNQGTTPPSFPASGPFSGGGYSGTLYKNGSPTYTVIRINTSDNVDIGSASTGSAAVSYTQNRVNANGYQWLGGSASWNSAGYWTVTYSYNEGRRWTQMYAGTVYQPDTTQTRYKGYVTKPAYSVNNSIYVGDISGNLKKLRTEDGALVWTKVPYAAPLNSIATTPNGNCYIGYGTAGNIYKLDSAGTTLWTSKQPQTTSAVQAIVIDKIGDLYGVNDYGNVYKINAAGTMVWQVAPQLRPITCIAIKPGVGLFVGYNTGHIAKLDFIGSVQWESKPNATAIKSICVFPLYGSFPTKW